MHWTSRLIVSLSLTTCPASYAVVPVVAVIADPPDGNRPILEAKFASKTISDLVEMIKADYFDPTIGAKVASKLQDGLSKGQYDKASDLESLAKLITEDMYSVAKDKHLSLFVSKAQPPQQITSSTVAQESRKERGQHENFGLQKVEVLPGNVGYLRVTAFYRPSEAREAIAASMALLSNTDALIVDLRDHGGGSSETVALFTSYFLDHSDMPLFEVTSRSKTTPDRYLTESVALAHRNESRPTFLLTSPRTSSGGEAVAFILQELHRAEVIGERTWGGANRVPNPRPVNKHFEALIPNGHTASSLTGKNWEGVGVIPDILVSVDNALRAAHARAIRVLLRSNTQGSWHEKLEQELALVEMHVGPDPKKH